MDKICVISVCVEEYDSVDSLNNLLHDYRNYIIGRMGIHYREKSVNVISMVIDAPEDKIDEFKHKINEINNIKLI